MKTSKVLNLQELAFQFLACLASKGWGAARLEPSSTFIKPYLQAATHTSKQASRTLESALLSPWLTEVHRFQLYGRCPLRDSFQGRFLPAGEGFTE